MSGPRRHDGQLGVFVDGYRAWLLERGYTPLMVTHALIALGHLGRWMEREGVDVDGLDDRAVRAFVGTQVRVRSRSTSGTTARAPGTCGSPRSGPCSVTPLCATPSTPP
jgi:hypothetical protein